MMDEGFYELDVNRAFKVAGTVPGFRHRPATISTRTYFWKKGGGIL
jgi:hypothetical protein